MKRRETYQWNRYRYETEPHFAFAIDYFKMLVMKGFVVNLHDKYWLTEKDVKLAAEYIVHDLTLLGDCFPFCDYDATKIVILNPDFVEVDYFLTQPDEPAIYMLPDEDLKKIIATKQPSSAYEKLPPSIIEKVLKDERVLLSKNCVMHLHRKDSAYCNYGKPFLRYDFDYSGQAATEILLLKIERCRDLIIKWLWTLPGFAGQGFTPIENKDVIPFFEITKGNSDLTPVSIRLEKTVIEQLKQLARKLSFEFGKDITHVDLVRKYIVEGLKISS
jgi:hypothetical protein